MCDLSEFFYSLYDPQTFQVGNIVLIENNGEWKIGRIYEIIDKKTFKVSYDCCSRCDIKCIHQLKGMSVASNDNYLKLLSNQYSLEKKSIFLKSKNGKCEIEYNDKTVGSAIIKVDYIHEIQNGLTTMRDYDWIR